MNKAKAKEKSKEKKCYVLMVSRYFPSTHKLHGMPTHFISKITEVTKIHTIRKNFALWQKRAEEISTGKAYLSLRYWSGDPYQSKQVEFKQLQKIGIEKISIVKKDENLTTTINDTNFSEYGILIAHNDGLQFNSFLNWFFPAKQGQFDGCIIHFTDFRYSDLMI